VHVARTRHETPGSSSCWRTECKHPSSAGICSRSDAWSVTRTVNKDLEQLTNFHLDFGTFSTSMIGSMKVRLPSDTSGIHIAQSR
jgi:hypothetical protein